MFHFQRILGPMMGTSRSPRASRGIATAGQREKPLMDLGTIIGLVLAWGAVVYSMHHCTHGELGAYVKPGEMLLVFGGAIGAAMMSMPLHTITGAVGFVKKWLFNKEVHIEHTIKEMVQY